MALQLQHLNFSVLYKPGQNHKNADGLSQTNLGCQEYPAQDVRLERGRYVKGPANMTTTTRVAVSLPT